MKVLLFSINRTVQEMIDLALRDVPGAELVFSREIGEGSEGDFDVMLVDDSMPLYRECLAQVEHLGKPKTVLLHQEAGEGDLACDCRVKKPFLPSEIREVVEQCVSVEMGEEITLSSGEEQADEKRTKSSPKTKKKTSKSKREKKETYRAETEVLNLDEIETIKALLEEDGLEIVHEEELAEKMLNEHQEEDNKRDALVQALRTMKPRKIRKLLRGAHVRIEITFPGDDA